MWWLWILAIAGALAATGLGALAFLILNASESDGGEEY